MESAIWGSSVTTPRVDFHHRCIMIYPSYPKKDRHLLREPVLFYVIKNQ